MDEKEKFELAWRIGLDPTLTKVFDEFFARGVTSGVDLAKILLSEWPKKGHEEGTEKYDAWKEKVEKSLIKKSILNKGN